MRKTCGDGTWVRVLGAALKGRAGEGQAHYALAPWLSRAASALENVAHGVHAGAQGRADVEAAVRRESSAAVRRPWFPALALACALIAAPAWAGPSFGPSLFGFGRPRPQPSLVFAYHGWRVDASRAARVQRADKTVRALQTQIDLVERLNLKPQVLTDLRAVPIQAEAGPGAREPAHFDKGVVIVDARALQPKHPTVLYGLMEAYMDRSLPGGFANPDIDRFRREAASRHIWPKTARMLEDDPDFFAATTSAYLYGVITREPYTRGDLKKTQPGYYQWLAKLFDEGRARG